MDTFAHFAWTVALFSYYRWKWWAGLVGILPDLLSFGLLFIGEIGHLTSRGPPAIETLPSWLFFMYGLTHSAVVFAAVFGIVWLVRKRVPLILLAWFGHIVIDMFTHTTAYFPTPVLWPLSDWVYVYGVSWASMPFALINYAALGIVWVLLVWHAIAEQRRQESIKSASGSSRP